MRKKILVVTPRFPIPSSGACEQDRLEGIKQLQRLGNEIQVVGKVFDFQDRNNIRAFEKEYGIPVHLISYKFSKKNTFAKNFISYLKRLVSPIYWDGSVYEYADPEIISKFKDILVKWKPDIVWFDYTFMLPLYPIARRSGCRIITRSLIYDPKNVLEEDGRTFVNYVRSGLKILTDFICIRGSDYMFAIAPDEMEMYERLGAKKIKVLPLRGLCNLIGRNSIVHDKKILNAFFLGSSYNISHNLEMARFIIEDVAPMANQRYPGKFNFFITGGKMPEGLRKKCAGNIKYTGFVDDLEKFLSDMDIALAPSLMGTGMQQKIFEPISRGFPTITSKRGLGGRPIECGQDVLCTVTAEEFVSELGKMLDINVRKTLSMNALKKSKILFSRENSDNVIKEAFSELYSKDECMDSFWKEKKVFITGDRGFIGSALKRSLELAGADVKGCRIDLLEEELKPENAGLTPEYIFHLAARNPSATDRIGKEDLIKDNINITKNVLEFARNTGAKVVLSSSTHVYPKAVYGAPPWKEDDMVYGNAMSDYGLSKQEVEKLCIDSAGKNGFELVIIRFSNIYGPGDESSRFLPTFINKCLDKKKPLDVFGNKRSIRDFLYIDDAVRAFLKSWCLFESTRVVNVGSSTGVSIEKIAEIVKNKAGMAGADINYGSSSEDKIPVNVLNSDKARKLMGFAPYFSLEEGISKTVEWWINKRKYN